MDKIYSRRRISMPKLTSFLNQNKSPNKNKTYKLLKMMVIMAIAMVTSNYMMQAINPIIDKQCSNMAKSIATKISNEQATIVMSRYKYDDLCTVTKDNNGNVSMISANVISVNEIISDIAVKIQKELEKEENNTFTIKMGSFLGNKLLAGRGPDMSIKMSTIGNLDTDLRSEFSSAGINQTLHKIYLQVECRVAVLTPFHMIEEEIKNQVLLAEVVIVGTTPNTYYNLEGMGNDSALEVME